MRLLEYQSKLRFAGCGIPVPHGRLASTPEQVFKIAEELGGTVIIKSQVPIGGRLRVGGIKVANSPDEAQAYAKEMLGREIRGLKVDKLLVEPIVLIDREYYLAIAADFHAARPVLLVSTQGGADVGRIAPNQFFREPIDPLLGIRSHQIVNIASEINLPREYWPIFQEITRNLYRCYETNDAIVAEINPLALTNDGELVALNSTIIIDECALFRHPDVVAVSDEATEEARSTRYRFLRLDGQIACIVSGAGLAMAMMDLIQLYGNDTMAAANFLDISDGVSTDELRTVFQLVLQHTNPAAMLVDLFDTAISCDELANRLSDIISELQIQHPIVARVRGVDHQCAIPQLAELPNVSVVSTLTEAVQLAIRYAAEIVS